MPMSDKRLRQAALLRLAKKKPLATQDETVEALRRSGFHATQSSVSRDLRELGLIRINGRYLPVAVAAGTAQKDGLPERDNELIISVEPVGANLIVIKTPVGAANAVAADLDGRSLPDVAGTVAGDDTIFVAVRSRAAQGRVAAFLHGVGGLERD
jgi:transcriptional regulator of arginine metabolism